MNIPRLKELVKLLRSIKVSDTTNFDMSHWFERKFKPATTTVTEELVVEGSDCKIKKSEQLEEGFCHTSACILGHAALHKPFNVQGLNVRYWGTPQSAFDADSGEDVQYVGGGIRYRGKNDSDAGRVFFGLTETQADDLFGGDFTTPKEGAKFIERMISQHEKAQHARKAA